MILGPFWVGGLERELDTGGGYCSWRTSDDLPKLRSRPASSGRGGAISDRGSPIGARFTSITDSIPPACSPRRENKLCPLGARPLQKSRARYRYPVSGGRAR